MSILSLICDSPSKIITSGTVTIKNFWHFSTPFFHTLILNSYSVTYFGFFLHGSLGVDGFVVELSSWNIIDATVVKELTPWPSGVNNFPLWPLTLQRSFMSEELSCLSQFGCDQHFSTSLSTWTIKFTNGFVIFPRISISPPAVVFGTRLSIIDVVTLYK